MKNLYLFLITIFTTTILYSQNQPFVTTWEVTASDLSITIPTHSILTYNYTVDFGDGTVLNSQTGDVIHTYNSAGSYTVTINGNFPSIYFNEFPQNNLNAKKIKSVEQWGDIQWQTMEYAFSGCSNLVINATDAPDLTLVNNLSGMFIYCESLNQSINHWDVSSISDMNSMFYYAESFNQPIANWDVSNVLDMSYMFAGANAFNQPIGNWDVSNVTDMSSLFYGASSFNQPLDNWDVFSVNNMSSLFSYADVFNQPLNNWNVSNVLDMNSMFFESSYNQNISSWDVSNVIDMSSMFYNSDFNQNISNWDVSSVQYMDAMFMHTNYNQPLNTWNLSSLESIENMFHSNDVFNQPLNNWNVSQVVNMDGVFWSADSFNQPLDNWDTSNVMTFTGMFYYAVSFNQDLANWDYSNVTILNAFLSYSGMDIINYDNLLNHFAASQLSNIFLGVYGLNYCNQFARDYLASDLNWQIYGDNAASNCNKITGTVLYDENNNGCAPNDIGVSGFMVNANDGNNNIISYSNQGDYEIGVVGTNFTVSSINYPSYYTVTPASKTVTFTTSNTEVADFCVTANQTIEDLNVTLLPTGFARPGFEADYRLIVENIGTQTVANTAITLDFDDTMQSFVSASVAPTSTTVNQLTFDIANLQPLTFQTIDITMQTFQPPTVNGNDILSFTANVSPSTNDYTPDDNTFVFDQVVVNSYDPNDKQVLQGEELDIDDTDEYLDYLIRFQNTGTASAINVRILDKLHPKLDYSTLKPVNASHNYRIEVTNDNEVEFIFEGINLPHESANEPASHGFIAYKIKPKSNVAIGDFIIGDANIYFDFNAPIVTNMVSTEIIDNVVGASNFIENQIVIYPNPTKSILNIEIRNNQQINEVKIYNLNGLELLKFKGIQKQINLESLSSGVYFIEITTDRGVVTKRTIKN